VGHQCPCKNSSHLECEEKVITTQGDKILDKPLPEIGGKGLFTQELESELLNGDVHCAFIHSRICPLKTLLD
jgi:hydroxymethylbilane synthase